MKKFLSFFAAIAFASAMVFGFTACKSNDDDDDDGDVELVDSHSSIVGEWRLFQECKDGDCEDVEKYDGITLSDDGTFSDWRKDDEGTWKLKGKTLKLKYDRRDNPINYKVKSLDNDELVLQREGSYRTMHFVRE